MTSIQKKANQFLAKHGMAAEAVSLRQNADAFMGEMEKGLKGGESSLFMIPTYISIDKKVPAGERIIVVDAGGTNFRVATVAFDDKGNASIDDFNNYPMPGTQGEITIEEFFDTAAKYLEPVIDKSDKIGFCFSYPTEIYPNRDGRLIRFVKEVKVKGSEGAFIGKGLLEAVKARGHQEKKSVVLVNDAVTTLIGGKAACPDRQFDSYVGFIWGTGTNTCYMEQNRNITKLGAAADTDGTMLINVESGGYGKAPRGDLDAEFDATTVNPGNYKFEKMISGAYQGGMVRTVLLQAAREGLFTQKTGEKILALKSLSAREIDQFLFHPYGENPLAACCGGVEEDCQVLYYLIDGLMERAARLVAFNLAAVMLKTGKGGNPCRPVCVTMDGSTYYKSKLCKDKLCVYTKSFLNEELGLYCEFIKAENPNLIGAAIAGLLNA